MKLSDAIRLGSMIKPQSFGDYRETHTSTLMGYPVLDIVHTCALGAALDAVGKLPSVDLLFEDSNMTDATVDAEFPVLLSPALCPVCGDEENDTVSDVVICLNDSHQWSRDRIADWVEIQETNERFDPQGAGQRAAAGR